jgi:hypothetical protein
VEAPANDWASTIGVVGEQAARPNVAAIASEANPMFWSFI